MKPLVRNAINLLDDAINYLSHIPDTAYAAPVDTLSKASVGQHTRHVLEFYQCLVDKLQANDCPQEKRIINYELRKRDKKMETCPKYAVQVIETLMEELAHLSEDIPAIWVVHPDALTETDFLIPSSLERELFYNIEHTIHHFALIRIGLNRVSPYIELPEHFGVAPSTMRFREKKMAPAS